MERHRYGILPALLELSRWPGDCQCGEAAIGRDGEPSRLSGFAGPIQAEDKHASKEVTPHVSNPDGCLSQTGLAYGFGWSYLHPSLKPYGSLYDTPGCIPITEKTAGQTACCFLLISQNYQQIVLPEAL